MHYAISYDIPDDRRRGRVKPAKVLLDFGNRVQYSVFEASLDKKLFVGLQKRKGDVLEDKDVYIL